MNFIIEDKKLTYIASYALLGLILSDILDQLTNFFLEIIFFKLIILLFSWVILLIIFYWIFKKTNNNLLKVSICIIILKIIYNIIFYKQAGFSKEIILIPLLFYSILVNDQFRLVLYKLINRYKYFIFILLLITILPFLGNNIFFPSGGFRFNAIWPNSKHPQLYLIAFMILFYRKNIIFVTSIYILILIMGGRQGMIASTLYYLFYIINYSIRFIKLNNYKKKIFEFAQLFIIIIFCILLYKNIYKLFPYVESNIAPLIEEEITSPHYGQGRVYLNQMLFNEIKKFNFSEIILGENRNKMEDFYESIMNSRTWPHNDLMACLFIYGIIGLLLYIYYTYIYPIYFFIKNKFYLLTIIVGVIFVLAITSGFYPYYSSFLIIAALGYIYEDNIKNML
jgi:hypothetical protein